MAELNIEKLGVEALYIISTKALKLVADRDAMVVKDFDYEGARVAPAITLACTCSFVDYESGLPTKVFVSVLNELTLSPKESHEKWLEQKRADGWKYGPEKNVELKTHPCFLPYDDLPQAQKAKDYIFGAIVEALKAHVVKGIK